MFDHMTDVEPFENEEPHSSPISMLFPSPWVKMNAVWLLSLVFHFGSVSYRGRRHLQSRFGDS